MYSIITDPYYSICCHFNHVIHGLVLFLITRVRTVALSMLGQCSTTSYILNLLSGKVSLSCPASPKLRKLSSASYATEITGLCDQTQL